MADTTLAAALFRDLTPVQAFPLGGKTYPLAVGPDALVALGADTTPAASVFLFAVPTDATVYVGRASDLDGLSVADARARMFPLSTGAWTFTLTDASQPGLRFLGDAGAPVVLVRVMEAGNR